MKWQWRRFFPSSPRLLGSPGQWIVWGILCGVLSGLGAAFFYIMLEAARTYLFESTTGIVAHSPPGEPPIFSPVATSVKRWLLLVVPTLGGLVSGLLVYTFAPEAEGHGTDAVIDAFHNQRGFIRKRIPIIKSIASAITIGTGGSAGREGPIAQIGAALSSMLSDLFRLGDTQRRLFLLCGLAGGIGAIFRAPLGGAIFAAEVLYIADFEAGALIPAIISSVVAFSVFSSIFGFGSEKIFHTPDVYHLHIGELPLFAALGILCAVVGMIYVKMFYGMRDYFFRKLPLPPHIKPAIGGFLVGVTALFCIEAIGGGYGVIQKAMSGNLAVKAMLIIGTLKIFTTCFTISSGGSGGVFAPSLFIGAMLGGAFGYGMVDLFPATVQQPWAYVLVGMSGFFSGVAKAPLATLFLVVEMTGSYGLLVPLILVGGIAILFTRDVTIYEKQVQSRTESAAHRGDFIVDVLNRIKVEQVYRKVPDLKVLYVDTHLADLRDVITETDQTYFPVKDREGNYCGILSLRSMRSIMFEHDLDDLVVVGDMMTPFVAVYLDENLNSCLQKFIEYDYGQLPVFSDEKLTELLGILTHEDVISAYQREVIRVKNK